MTSPPLSESELLALAGSLTGHTLGRIAADRGIPVPDDLLSHKGWVGELIEQSLGADAGSRPEPDFTQLGIELKTIPVQTDGSVQESTFVCSATLINEPGYRWETSLVRKKLAHVLWVPIEADHATPLSQRRVGNALLWQPGDAQERILEQDWNEIMDYIVTGQLDCINAEIGHYLQLRPKAANAKALCEALDADGNIIQTLPRGFYLRARFTREILAGAYL